MSITSAPALRKTAARASKARPEARSIHDLGENAN